MNHYEEDDRVFIFGFSRGAYTARAIAALIAKCGLLNKGNDHLVPYATKMFRYERRARIYRGFRKTFSSRFPIHFLGLWETVKSVGWVYDPISFQFTANNPIVKTIRHALAIDERRTFFRQNLWGKGRSYQDIKQVWFASDHSDIGGGYPADDSGPSDIALDWMIRQAQPDLLVDQAKLKALLPGGAISTGRPKLHESLKAGGRPPNACRALIAIPQITGKDAGRFIGASTDPSLRGPCSMSRSLSVRTRATIVRRFCRQVIKAAKLLSDAGVDREVKDHVTPGRPAPTLSCLSDASLIRN